MESVLKPQFLKMSLNIKNPNLTRRACRLRSLFNRDNLQSKFYAFLAIMSALLCLNSTTTEAATREYWIAAEKVEWNYAPSGENIIRQKMVVYSWGKAPVYEKYRYF